MSRQFLVIILTTVSKYCCGVAATEAATGRYESYQRDFYVEKNSFFRLDENINRKGMTMTAKCRPLCSSKLTFCNIGVEKSFNSSKREPETLCSVALWGDKTQDLDLKYLSDDKAVITYFEKNDNRQMLKLHLVDIWFCEKIRFDFDSTLQSNIITHEDYFDVFIAGRERCGSLEKCRIRYDQYGEPIGDPVPFMVENDYVHISLVTGILSKSEVFFVLSPFTSETKLSMVDESGIEKHLASFKTDYYGSIFSAINTPHSNAQGKYGLCTDIRSESLNPHFPKRIHCLQYDTMGNLKMDEEMKLFWNEMVLKVHNLPGDGIILITSQCTYAEHYDRQENVEEMGMIDREDKIISSLPDKQFEKLSLDESADPKFYYDCHGIRILTMHANNVEGLLYQTIDARFRCDPGELYANVSEDDEELCFQLACFHNSYTQQLPNSSFTRTLFSETACIHKIMLKYTST